MSSKTEMQLDLDIGMCAVCSAQRACNAGAEVSSRSKNNGASHGASTCTARALEGKQGTGQ
jgi:hypothetical protein